MHKTIREKAFSLKFSDKITVVHVYLRTDDMFCTSLQLHLKIPVFDLWFFF